MYIYNQDFKVSFLNDLIENNKKHTHMYNLIFKYTKETEIKYNRDLYTFDNIELLKVFKSISKNYKYTTILTLNSLIKEYKQYAISKGIKNINKKGCTVKQLKTLDYKTYIIFNDDDIKDMTEYAILDGADLNVALFIRVYWEINQSGLVKPEDVLNLKIQDLDSIVDKDGIKYFLNIRGKNFRISRYLAEFIKVYADIEEIEFAGRRGKYKMLTAENNNGYVIRRAVTKKNIVGAPISLEQFSGIVHKYCCRNDIEHFTIGDITMSLALKYMLKNHKTHAEMTTEELFFSSILSSVYKDVFEQYALNKYPKLYKEYVEYYVQLAMDTCQ